MGLLWAFIFFLGAAVGSFLNVLVLRFATGESVARGRSRCFSCGRELGALELVPLLSFMFQRGRCKHCGSKISWQYPAVELLSGLVFTLVAWKIFELGAWSLPACNACRVAIAGRELGSQVSALQVSSFKLQVLSYLYWVAIFSLLLAISVYDARHKIIPNQFVYPLIILAIFAPLFLSGRPRSVYFTDVGLPDLVPGLLSGLGAFLFFAGLWFISGGAWMGFGDAKLALAIGFFLSTPNVIAAVVFSFWIGTLVMLPLVLARGRSLKAQIPFAPFLAAGALVVWLAGEKIVGWYFSIF